MKNITLFITLLLVPTHNFAESMQQQKPQQTQKTDQQEEQSAAADYLQSPEYGQKLEEEFKKKAENKTNSSTNTKPENTIHERICPTCGHLASTCPTDQDRLSRGIVLTCGCSKCGGTGNN